VHSKLLSSSFIILLLCFPIPNYTQPASGERETRDSAGSSSRFVHEEGAEKGGEREREKEAGGGGRGGGGGGRGREGGSMCEFMLQSTASSRSVTSIFPPSHLLPQSHALVPKKVEKKRAPPPLSAHNSHSTTAETSSSSSASKKHFCFRGL
jgi:hypothetical protein